MDLHFQQKNGCIFCKIAQGKDSNTVILYQDDDLVVFPDHRPATDHHYLVITKTHIKNAGYLQRHHVAVVEKMVAVGKQVIEEQGGLVEDIRLGAHWPPAVLVSHFHIHVISPASQMGFFSRLLFRPNSFWFSTTDWLVNHLKSLPEESNEQKGS